MAVAELVLGYLQALEPETTDMQPEILGPQTQEPQSLRMPGVPTVTSKVPLRGIYESTDAFSTVQSP